MQATAINRYFFIFCVVYFEVVGLLMLWVDESAIWQIAEMMQKGIGDRKPFADKLCR